MKKYSFVKEAEDHFVIHHEKDGEFKVAKKGLKKGLSDKIGKLPKFMAEGGEVEEDYPTETEKEEPSNANPFFPSWEQAKEAGSNLLGYAKSAAPTLAFPGVETQPKNPDVQQTAYQPVFPEEKNKILPEPEQPKQQPAQPIPETPNFMGSMGHDYNQIAGGIQKAAEAESKAQKQIADTIQENALIQQEQYNSMLENRKRLDTEHAQLTKDFMEQKIDPHSVWNRSGTAGKISAALGMILAGIGSGFTGGPNMALKVLEDAQNRDIEAQKSELGKKQNLLSMNLKKYGDLESAYNATRLQQNAMMTADLQRIAATTNSAVTQANAQKAIGMLNMDRDQKLAQMGAQMQIKEIASGRIPVSAAQVSSLPQDLQQKAVVIPGSNRAFFAGDEKMAEKAREATAAASETETAIREAEAFQAEHGRTLPGSTANKEAQRIRSKLQVSLAKLYSVGRETTPEEKQKIYDSVPDVGAFRQQDLTNALSHIRTTSNAKLDSIYGQYLPSYRGPKIRAQETAPVLTQQQSAPSAQKASLGRNH